MEYADRSRSSRPSVATKQRSYYSPGEKTKKKDSSETEKKGWTKIQPPERRDVTRSGARWQTKSTTLVPLPNLRTPGLGMVYQWRRCLSKAISPVHLSNTEVVFYNYFVLCSRREPYHGPALPPLSLLRMHACTKTGGSQALNKLWRRRKIANLSSLFPPILPRNSAGLSATRNGQTPRTRSGIKSDTCSVLRI